MTNKTATALFEPASAVPAETPERAFLTQLRFEIARLLAAEARVGAPTAHLHRLDDVKGVRYGID